MKHFLFINLKTDKMLFFRIFKVLKIFFITKKEPVTPVSLNTSSNADSSFEHTQVQREPKSIPEGIIPLPELSKSHRALIEENKEMREQMRRMQKQIDDLSKKMRRYEKMNI